MKLHTTPEFFLGIDVGKCELHCHLITPENHHKHCFPNDKQGRRQLIAWLKKHSLLEKTILCIEHTGHYGKALCFEIARTKIAALFVVNPRQIKAFGQQRLRRNKTDSADAKLIAEFISKEYNQLHLWQPPGKAQQEVTPLNRHLENLTQQRAKLKTQLQTTDCKPLQQSLQRLIKNLDKEIQTIEKKSTPSLPKTRTSQSKNNSSHPSQAWEQPQPEPSWQKCQTSTPLKTPDNLPPGQESPQGTSKAAHQDIAEPPSPKSEMPDSDVPSTCPQ